MRYIFDNPINVKATTYHDMNYKGFPYTATEISAFAVTYGIFVISLKNGRIIQHKPEAEDDFYNWLMSLDIREVVAA